MTENFSEEALRAQLKPLSANAFAAFFQRLARGWLSAWYGFADKCPKLANSIYMVFFFFVFSMGVTIWQYIVMTFLPYAFESLGTEAWGWPALPVKAAGGNEYILFGDIRGLGYFVAFEIATFTAQCINFPLQRNVTYRSHGNPWFQAMWYFIGWVLVSVFTSAVWGICNCFLLFWKVPDAACGLLKTFLTGGVSMVIFFFIFLIIFPNNDKLARKAKKKYEALAASDKPQEKKEKAYARYRRAQDRADLANAEKTYRAASARVNSRVLAYFSLKGKQEKAERERAHLKEELQTSETGQRRTLLLAERAAESELLSARLGERKKKVFEEAVRAVGAREERKKEYEAVAARVRLAQRERE